MSYSRRDFVRTLFAASVAGPLLNLPIYAADPAPGALNFAIIGDWGRLGREDQTAVADQMAIACEKAKASFVISVGDNFYDFGVTSATDPQFAESFENVYHAKSLQVPWYVILGNHDYRGNCDAQITYGQSHPRWIMPARYFSKVHDVAPGSRVEIFYMDTSPFVLKYRTEPTMMKEILSQNTAEQLKWLDGALAASTAQWKLVIGHHPIYSSGIAHGNQPELIEHLLPLLQKHKVPAYFAGHDHDMEHLKAGDITLIVSGGGSQHRPVKETKPSAWVEAVSGFAMASLTPDQLKVDLLNEKGQVLHTSLTSRAS